MSDDRSVGTSGDAKAAFDAGIVIDPYQWFFDHGRTDRTDTHAGQAADAGLGQYREHRFRGDPGGPGEETTEY
jgi:hypothetical protein